MSDTGVLGCDLPRGRIPEGTRSYNKEGCGLTVMVFVGGTKYRVVLDSGLTRYMNAKEIRNGAWKDAMSPQVCGVGYVGKGEYPTKINGKRLAAYEVWRGAIRRCYDTSKSEYYRYGGKGVVVADIWHNYQNFAEWYTTEVNKLPSVNLELDKDLKGGNIYSPENCILLPYKLNNFITNSKTDNNLVGYNKPHTRGKYTVTLSMMGRQHFIGDFANQEDGDLAYRKLREWVYNKLATLYHERGLISEDTFQLLTGKYTTFSSDELDDICNSFPEFIKRVTTFLNKDGVLTERVRKIY
jgi:hypothetical protein